MGFSYIPQLDESDCGVACLAMILKKYRSLVSLQKLREVSETDSSGTSAYGLKRGFEHYGFDFQALQANSDYLLQSNVQLPLIAHLMIDEDYTHYVVIYRIKGHQLYIADPGKGKSKISIDEFCQSWTGILLTAQPTPEYQPVKQLGTNLFKMTKMLKSFKGLVAIIILVTLITTILGLLSSFYFQVLLDSILPQKSLNLLTITSIGLLTLYVVRSLTDFSSNILLARLGQQMGLGLMRHYIRHVLKLPMSFFETRKTGEIFTRFVDASKIIDAIASAVLTIFIDVSMLLVISVILSLQNRFLFLITLIVVPLYCGTMLAFYQILNRVNRNEMASGARFNANFIESLKGIETVKAYGEEPRIFVKLNHYLTDLLKKSYRVSVISQLHEACKQVIQFGCSGILLWIGAKYVINGQLSIGQLITYNALLGFYMGPLENIVTLQTKVQTAKIAADRLNEVLEINPELPIQSKTVKPTGQTIRMEKVSFSYKFDEPTLMNINLTVQPGEKVALVGASGSGKSTLAKLLVKFYEPDSGTICYGNHKLDDLQTDEIRSQITYVPQESFFFSGSILDNLLFGVSHTPNDEELFSVCHLAGLDEFIDSQPLGLQSILEEKGSNLSGGQKQRLALARALLQDSKTIILDEATSGLDVLTEKQVIRNLMQITGRTIIFIAHHLKIAQQCDSVYVMNHGQLIEHGSHDVLMAQAGLYEKLWIATY